jgi:hypothetical protein
MASSSTSASCHRKSKTGHFQIQIRPQGLKSGQYQIATEDPGFAVDEPVESLGHDLKLPPFLEARRTRARRAVARAAGRKWTERVSSILRLLPRGVRKGDGPAAKSLKSPPSDLTRLSEANNGVFPVSRVHEVIDGRVERLVHGTRNMPVWGDRYMREMASPESGGWVSKEWDEAIVRRRILALVEYISTLQRATRRRR